MPSNVTAKIKSALKRRETIALLFVTCLLAAAVWMPRQSEGTTLRAGERKYTLEKAVTADEQRTGLSGRTALPKNKGMLFIFTKAEPVCFWMKDMRFPLDIIWLDGNKKVVHLVEDARPSSYPDTFCPDDPARYVIELNAGEAAEAGIRTGQELSF